MKSSENINEISTALCKFQGSLYSVKKDSRGYNYNYANLASIWETIRMPLLENGLSVVQDAYTAEGAVCVSTRILHVSGQWLEFGPLIVPMAKKDAHTTGSATTYGRKYGLGGALGLVADDDDGEAANGKATSEDKKTREFINKWKVVFEEGHIVGYIKERAKKLNKNAREVAINYFFKDDEFKKDLDSWLAKKSMEAENENE